MIQSFWVRGMLAMSNLREREDGQTLVEYALIIALVSVALVGALGLVTDSIGSVFSRIISALDAASFGRCVPAPRPQLGDAAPE